MAVVGLDGREVLESLGVADARGDLVGDLGAVGGRFWVFAGFELAGGRGQEGAGGRLAVGAGAVLPGFVDGDDAQPGEDGGALDGAAQERGAGGLAGVLDDVGRRVDGVGDGLQEAAVTAAVQRPSVAASVWSWTAFSMRRAIVSIVCAYSRIASRAPSSPQPAT